MAVSKTSSKEAKPGLRLSPQGDAPSAGPAAAVPERLRTDGPKETAAAERGGKVRETHALAPLRRRIRVEVPKNGKAGCVWGDGGIVTKVVSGGAAATAGVTTCACPKQSWLDAPCGCPDAWRIVYVQGASLAPLCTAKFIGDLLAAARAGGQYYLIFEACAPTDTAAEPDGPSTYRTELDEMLDAVLDARPDTEFDIVAGASEISDWLLLGTAAVAKDVLAGRRPELRVDAILNCVCDLEEPSDYPDAEALRRAGLREYSGFWAYDNAEYDILSDYWQHARAFLERAREQNLRVLVHCSMGVNRSAAIACAFLVEKEGFGLCEAAALLHHRRGGVLGNEGFRRQLAALAMQCGRP